MHQNDLNSCTGEYSDNPNGAHLYVIMVVHAKDRTHEVRKWMISKIAAHIPTIS
jgi:hypothetical protein